MADNVKTLFDQKHLGMLQRCLETKDLRRWNQWRKEHAGTTIQLAGANLEGAALKEVDLRGADLRGANLQGADLQGANLRKANLEGALLFRADLRKADLQAALLWGADLKGANLEGADCTTANLTKANFEGAKLKGAHFDSKIRLVHPLPEAKMASVIINRKGQENQSMTAPGNDKGSPIKVTERYKVPSTGLPDKFQDAGVIVRAIVFDRENVQAGVGILSYFSEILIQKYENRKVKVLIEQDGLNVRLAIETGNGDKQTIEKALEEYIAAVTGRKPLTEFLSKPLGILALKLRLELAYLDLRHTEALHGIKQDGAEKRKGGVDRLHNLLSNSICIRWR
jgi:hypothetical protein